MHDATRIVWQQVTAKVVVSMTEQQYATWRRDWTAI